MGILYRSVELQKKMKREFVLERLKALGIMYSQQGQPIQECDYETLKYELVLASFKQIDVEGDSAKWF